ncbi:MAG: hypothetical protein AB1449_12895 [Chloroflexota bacterium]
MSSSPEAEKITIIEGPPPTFEAAVDPWAYGLSEGPVPSQVALCRLRTFNGPALVERCYRAWHRHQPVMLEYRGQDGQPQTASIIAARWVELDEGQVLLLWVCLPEGDVEFEFEMDDGFDEEPDEPDLDSGL